MKVKKKGLWVGVLGALGLVLSLALMASPALGAADGTLTIKNMKVSVWPEYDDPRILVTYTGEFNNTPAFPQPVKFPVPTSSEILQVCALQPNNEHLCQLYDTLTEADNLVISYTLPIPTYYLEYYWNGIKAEADKSFTVNYVSPYAVDRLEIEVQQPLKAVDFKPDQSQPYTTSSDGRGMKYYHYIFNNVTPGQAISLDASYTKPDNTPSVAKKAATQSGGTTGGNNYGVVLGIGAGLLVAVAVGAVLLRRKPALSRAESRRAARITARHTGAVPRTRDLRAQSRPTSGAAAPARPIPTAKTPQTAGVAFCRHCGTRLAPGAAFCHTCGEKAG